MNKIRFFCLLIALWLAGRGAHAASGTWTGLGANAQWATSGNWAPGIPGATSGATNSDTAWFNRTISGNNGTTSAVVVGSGQIIGNIQFNTPSTSAFVIGVGTGNALRLSAGGRVLSSINATETIAAPFYITGTGCSFSAGGGSSGVLTFTGTLSGTSAGSVTVTLTGDGSGAVGKMTGIINNGIASTLGFTQSGGTWSLQNNSNSFSGGITMQSGTLQVTSGGAIGTGTLALAGGLLQNSAGSAMTFANNNPELWLGNFSVNGGGAGLTTGTGAVTLSANRTVIVTNTVTIGGPVSDGGMGYSLSGTGSGTLVFTGSNHYSGATNVNSGTIQIGNNTATPFSLAGGVNIASGATFTFKTNSSGTCGTISGLGTLTDSGTGVVTVYQGAGFSGTIAAINGSGGSTLNLSGDPMAGTTITNTLTTGGQAVKFKDSTWTLNGDGSYSSNLEVDGGHVIRAANTGNFFNIYSFVVTGGTFDSLNNYGFRLGSTFGPGDNSGQPTLYSQTGGMVNISGNDASVGSSSSNVVASFTLTGGTFSVNNSHNFGLGAGTSGTGVTMLSLGGNGKLIIAGGKVYASQAGGAQQIFSFTGGTLAASQIDATNLSGTAAPAQHGTFYNSGGVLAPGDIGAPGQTTITGNYAVSSTSALLAIDLSGPTPAAAFQDAAGTYDNVFVSGTASLNGRLAIYLVNGFVPSSSVSFTILSAGAISGAFTNATFGQRMTTADGLGSFVVSKSGNAIVLSSFVWLSPVPAITVQPLGASVLAGKTVTMTVGVSGSSPFSYQWYKVTSGSATAIATGTTNFLTLGGVQASDAADYYVQVANASGVATSSIATLGVTTGYASGMIYDMDTAAVTGAGAIPDSLGTTAGTMINTGNGLPALIAGATAFTGSAWDFSSASASIQVGPSSFIDTLGDTSLSTGITVGMWVRYQFQVNSSASWQRAAGLGSDNTLDVAEFGGNLQITLAGDNVRTPSVVFANDHVMDGAWHHVVATYDFQQSANNACFYVDGKKVSGSTVAVRGSFSAPGTTMGIGAYSNGQLSWPGQLDQFVCFNRALTASEVSSLYTTGTITNQAPQVVVSADATTIQWPYNSTTLHAAVSDDGLPNPPGATTLTWSSVRAPSGNSAILSSSTSANPAITFSGTGTYVMRCTASDGALSNYGDITFNVTNNTAPTITALSASPTLISDTLPNVVVNLGATAVDDGFPSPPGAITTTWSQLSGPAAVSIPYPALANTMAIMPQVDGTYILQLSVSDGALTTATTVTINVVNNLAPAATATADNQAIVWNGSAGTTLRGSVTDDRRPAGGTLSGTWTQLSGPATATLATPSRSGSNNGSLAASSAVTFPAEGQYVFQFMASDGVLATTATTYVTVWSPGRPIVIPGSSRSVWLPNASLTLSGSLAALSGSNPAVQWSLYQTSGTGVVIFGTPNALATTAVFSAAGTYWLQLTATDGAYVNSNRLVVEVYDSSVTINNWRGVSGVPSGNFGYSLASFPGQTSLGDALNTNFSADFRTPIDYTGIAWSRLTPPPPPYIHPRVLFNPEDMPDLRARLANTTGSNTEGPVVMNNIRSSVSSALTGNGAQYRSIYDDLSNGLTGSFAASASQLYISNLIEYEAFRCLIDNDTAGGAKCGAALSTMATYVYGQLQNAGTPAAWQVNMYVAYDETMGFAYDFCYNFMSGSQQANVRQAISLVTSNAWATGMDAIPAYHANSTNWDQWNLSFLTTDSLAIEGETGYDANLLPRLQAAYERIWSLNIMADGAMFEGMGKGAAFADAIPALAKRGVMIAAITGPRNHIRQFYMHCMETSGYGFTWDEWSPGNGTYGNNSGAKYSDVAVMKYLFPGDPVIDFVHRNELGITGTTATSYLTSSRLTGGLTGFPAGMHEMLGRAIFTQDYNTSIADWNTAAAAQVAPNLPLTQLFNTHGIVVTRSDWSSNGVRLMFQPRTEPGGHAERDRNVFMLSGLGRIWVPYSSPNDNVPYDFSQDSSVMRVDNMGPSTIPAKMVDYYDSASFTYAAGDASLPYNWIQSNTGSVQSWTPNQTAYNPSPLNWENMQWGMLPDWYTCSGSAPLYWSTNVGVQTAFRTAALIRGTNTAAPYLNSYAVIVDDFRKDAASHSYISRLILWPDLTSITISGSDAIVTTGSAGAPSLLVRVIKSNTPATLAKSAPDSLNALDVNSTSTTGAGYITLLIPFTGGTSSLPGTAWMGDVMNITWPGGQVDRLKFAPDPDGRTRVAFSRPTVSTGTAAPVFTSVPANITGTTYNPAGMVETYNVTAQDAQGNALTPACTPPSGSLFPVGTTTVNCYATDANLNSSGTTFTVTIQLLVPGNASNLVVTPGFTTNVLTWTAATGAASYTIGRSNSPNGPFGVIASGITGTTYTDSGLTTGVSYYYTVTAVNNSGSSSPTAATPGQPTPGYAVKADNTTTLDQGASWNTGVIPTPLDGATWNGIYTNPAVSVGAGLAVGALQITGPSQAITINAGTGNLTLESGGIDMSGAAQNLTIAAPVVIGTSQAWNIAYARSLIMSGTISDGGFGYPLVKNGPGTLVITGNCTYTGSTTIAAGTLQVGNATATPWTLTHGVNIASGATLAFNTTLGGTASGIISGPGTLRQSGTVGIITVSPAAGFSGTIGTIGGVSGGTLILAGDPSATTNISSTLNDYGFTAKFVSGTWNMTGGGSYQANIEIDGGTVNRPPNTGDFFNIRAFTMHGGVFNSSNQYGMRMGSIFGPGDNSGQPTACLQDGGVVTVSANDASIGSSSSNVVESFTLTGGAYNVTNSHNLAIGSGTSGTGLTTFTLGGAGALVVSGGKIYGSQGIGAQQVFAFTGGTLAASQIDVTYLSGTANPTQQGTLYNCGGTLAPGLGGAAGRTVITGNYTVTATNSWLSIDVTGTTQASGFQTGQYDYVSISGSAQLGGMLAVSLGNSFNPSSTGVFTILSAARGVSGSFGNVSFGQRLLVTGSQGSFVVNTSGSTITLSGYAAFNGPGTPAATGSNGSVLLSWAAPAGAPAGTTYTVLQSGSSGGPYTQLATGLTGTSYIDTGETPGTSAYYVVTASYGGLTTSPSGTAAGAPMVITSPLSASGTNGTPFTYQITASGSAASFSTSTLPSGLSLNPGTGVISGTPQATGTFGVVISAFSPGGQGNSTLVFTLLAPLPAAPGVLTASAGYRMVTLAWGSSPGASGYNVFRSQTSGAGYAAIAGNIQAGTYTDSPLTDWTTYYYVVTAVNATGQSLGSPEAFATPQSAPIGSLETSKSVALTLSGTLATVTFKATVVGHQYQLQYIDTLSSSLWQNYGPAANGTGSDMLFPAPYDPAKRSRFYRFIINQM